MIQFNFFVYFYVQIILYSNVILNFQPNSNSSLNKGINMINQYLTLKLFYSHCLNFTTLPKLFVNASALTIYFRLMLGTYYIG